MPVAGRGFAPGAQSSLFLRRQSSSSPSAPWRRYKTTRTGSGSGSNSSNNNMTPNPPPPKPSNILGKPDQFRPPSHGSRIVRSGSSGSGIRSSAYADTGGEPRNYPGPRLSAREAEERRKKKYPHMFPAEGTVMYRFLTNRGIHVWISMGVLFTLAGFTFTTNFKESSPYADMLPRLSGIFLHPIATVSQFIHVLRLHQQHVSLETAERRKRNIDDVEKRRQYRVAHGLEAESEADRASREKAETEAGAAKESGEVETTAEGEHVEVERKRKPLKKWLGIW